MNHLHHLKLLLQSQDWSLVAVFSSQYFLRSNGFEIWVRFGLVEGLGLESSFFMGVLWEIILGFFGIFLDCFERLV
jgi:hypothetical protein